MSRRLSKRRKQLKALEKGFQSRFDSQTERIQSFSKSKQAKILVLAAAGALVGLVTYRALSSSDEGEKQKASKKVVKSKFTADLISKAIKSLLPYIIDKLDADQKTQK